MADDPNSERPSGMARPPAWRAAMPRRMIFAFVIVVALLALVTVFRMVRDARELLGGSGRTTLSQEMVLEEVREVAKLVSTEMTLRDVVTYRNTRYGSTKQALLVVTGKILAGIDLSEGTTVEIDSVGRRLTITIPEAKVLAVDIVQLRTYDEQRGLWNPFQPADRDAIYAQVRQQLQRTAGDMGIVRKANESAARMLEKMFSVDGYVAEVRFAGGTVVPVDGPRVP